MKRHYSMPLSRYRPDVLVSAGVSERFSESDLRQALRLHEYSSPRPTRVQVGPYGSVIIASNPREQTTVVVRPDEWRELERSERRRRR